MKVHFDKATEEWLRENPFLETTVTECVWCGCFYSPRIGHECKVKKKIENNIHRQAKRNATIKADTVMKMRSEIEARCIKGGIYSAFVARTIDQIAEEFLEGKI